MSAHITVVDRWACGSSLAPYDRANVGVHVGDVRGTVASNRLAACELAGVPFESTVVMSPVHGNTVVEIDEAASIELTDVGRVAPPADALFTRNAGVGLMVMGADCAPVTISGVDHHGAPAIAVVHVGWKGLAADVLGQTLSLFDAQSAAVAVHPCICGNHYPVPRERAALVPAASVIQCEDGQVGIDLRAGLVAQCERAGVKDVQIDPRCTFEFVEFFSHRRDAVTGRFAVLAWM